MKLFSHICCNRWQGWGWIKSWRKKWPLTSSIPVSWNTALPTKKQFHIFTYSFHLYSRSSHNFILFHSFHGLINSINWPAPSVWVFMGQPVEHCSENSEATGSNPFEAPKKIFSGYFAICDSTAMVRYLFHILLAGTFCVRAMVPSIFSSTGLSLSFKADSVGWWANTSKTVEPP